MVGWRGEHLAPAEARPEPLPLRLGDDPEEGLVFARGDEETAPRVKKERKRTSASKREIVNLFPPRFEKRESDHDAHLLVARGCEPGGHLESAGRRGEGERRRRVREHAVRALGLGAEGEGNEAGQHGGEGRRKGQLGS